MATKVEDAAYLVLVEHHIAELEARLAALRDVIFAMNSGGKDTSHQAELFANMAEAIRAVQRFREEVLSHNNAPGAPDADG